MTRVVITGQGKPEPAKTIQSDEQGCQSQLDKTELGKAKHDQQHDKCRIGPGPGSPTELVQLRQGIDQSKSNQSGQDQARYELGPGHTRDRSRQGKG